MSTEQQEIVKDIIKSLEKLLASMTTSNAKHHTVSFGETKFIDVHNIFNKDVNLVDLFESSSDVGNLVTYKLIDDFETLYSVLSIDRNLLTDAGVEIVGSAILEFMKKEAPNTHALLSFDDDVDDKADISRDVKAMMEESLLTLDKCVCETIEKMYKSNIGADDYNRICRILILGGIDKRLKCYYVTD